MNRNLIVGKSGVAVMKKSRAVRLAVCVLLSLALVVTSMMVSPPKAYASGVTGMTIKVPFYNAWEYNEEALEKGQGGEGYSWSADNNTLTLQTGFVFEYISFSGTGDVIIDVYGNVQGGSIDCEAGTLAITGDANSVLSLSSTTGNALYSDGNLFIESLTIGAQTSANFAAVETNGNFHMVSGTLNLAGTGTNSSGLSVSGQITIIGTAIVQTVSGSTPNNGAIYADGNITIGGNSQVTVECDSGSVLYSGKTIRISGNAEVEAAAGDKNFPATVAVNGLIVEGGNLTTGLYLPDSVSIQGNVTVSGGKVIIYDALVGNLTVQGGSVYGVALDVRGNVTISEGVANVSAIAGNLTASGGQTLVGGSVGGDLIVSGGNVTIGGNLGGVVTATGGNVTIGGVPLSSNAGLTSVAGQLITATGTGTQNSLKTASISVPNSKTSIAAGEIVAATGATKKLSSTNAFSNNLTSAPLAVGSNHLYILITAQNGTSKLYYDITVTRQAAENNGNGNSGNGGNGGNNGGGNGNDVNVNAADNSAQIANVTAIWSPLTTLYLKKGKAFTPPVDFDGKDAKGKTWGYKGYGTAPKLTWKSNKTSVATVNPATGKITAKKVGTAKITATALNGKAKITFTVKVVKKALKPKKLVLTKPPKSLAVGKTKVLKVKLTSAKATGIKVTFKSSKPSILSVDKAGKLFALNTGTAKITVKAGGKSKVITVKVK